MCFGGIGIQLSKDSILFNRAFVIQYRWTALLWSCDGGHSDVVKYLVEHGADVNAEDVSILSEVISVRINSIHIIV